MPDGFDDKLIDAMQRTSREIGGVHRAMESLSRQVEKQTDHIDDLRKEVAQIAVQQKDIDHVQERVTKLEDSQRWLVRLVIGAVLMAILGLVIGTGALGKIPK